MMSLSAKLMDKAQGDGFDILLRVYVDKAQP
jgi:hypothetical protein